MLDLEVVEDACRARLRTLVVATTGSATLAASTVGYTRASGSFLTDRFAKGMEVKPVGFTDTTRHVVQDVSATLLTIVGGLTAQAAGASRSIVAGLPQITGADNIPAARVAGRPYVTEQFVPTIAPVTTQPMDGGSVEERCLYVVTWYVQSGIDHSAIRRSVQAVRALFTPGTLIGSGDNRVRVRGKAATLPGQIIRLDDGWSRCTFTAELYAFTRNTVAA